MPVVFPNVNTEHYTLVDGFVYVNLPLTESILKCREFGFDDKDIIVDIVLCSNYKMEIKQLEKKEAEYLNAYDIYNRRNEFQNYYSVYEDVLRVMRGYPNVQFRHLIAPSENMNSSFLFDDIGKTHDMMNLGYRDAEAVITRWYEQLKELECKRDLAVCDKSKEDWEKAYRA